MESFFYNSWVARLEQLLPDLLSSTASANKDSTDGRHHHHRAHDLISRTLSHFRSYYEERTRAAAGDVLVAYNSPWLTPLERTFLWVGGWKPSLAFHLIPRPLLCPQQETAVKELEREATAEEARLTEEMAILREAVAAPQVLAVVRRWPHRPRNGEARADEEAVTEQVVAPLRTLLATADRLRAKVVRALLDVLSAEQGVEFLAAAVELQLRIRRWGLQRADLAAGTATAAPMG